MRQNTLVLFDVDKTLVDATEITTEAFYRAFKEKFNVHATYTDVKHAGVPFFTIIANLIEKVGGNPTGKEVHETYLKILEHERRLVKTMPVHVMDGVFGLLCDLSCLPNVCIGLLTGNPPEILELLLSTAKLNFFRKDLWSLGSEWKTRAEGVLLAKHRCEKNRGMRVDKIVVVGDSDVEIIAAKQAQKETGVPTFVVSVATGSFSREQLEKLGANLVVDNFAKHGEVAKLILAL